MPTARARGERMKTPKVKTGRRCRDQGLASRAILLYRKRRREACGAAATIRATMQLGRQPAGPTTGSVTMSAAESSLQHSHSGNTVQTADGSLIYYKDWGSGAPVVFSHGWPLSSDAWEDQMFFLASRGFRCIAHDRRGHGRSSQTWQGNDMDTYADDLAELVQKLDLSKAIHIGHSTGGGEVARYIGRYGTGRVAKAVLIGAVPPIMLKTT